MSLYYLMAQLPSLDALSPMTVPPITEDRFFSLCRDLLPKKAKDEIKKLTLIPKKEGEHSASALLRAFYEGERELRLALSYMRAERLKKSLEMPEGEPSLSALQTAKQALECTDPKKAELMLSSYRLELLENLRPSDCFSLDSVFYYAIKLKLLWRLCSFDQKQGEQVYKDLYNQALRGASEEVIL